MINKIDFSKLDLTQQRLVAIRVKEEVTAKSGLILSGNTEEQRRDFFVDKYKIVAFSPKVKELRVEVKRGDFFLAAKQLGTDFDMDGVTYTIIDYDNIFGFINE